MNGYLNQVRDECAVFNRHSTARFEWVASKKKYRIVYTDTKIVCHALSGFHATTEEAWREAALKIVATPKAVPEKESHD